MARVGLVSLGCPKNTVDAEEILGEIARAGHEIETDPALAEVLIVNTCGFIQSAKEESIEAILEAVGRKTSSLCRSVLVTGCLAQRYGSELAKELPEVDAVIGLGKVDEILQAVNATIAGEKVLDVGDPGPWWLKSRGRLLSTAPWTAYLRVADGCDNRCSYCSIPDIRGGFASRPERNILEEATALAEMGVRELNLVAQDVTRYGLDMTGELRLHLLLDKLSEIEGIHWIRLLYCYPTRVSDDLIRVIAENPKVCPYLDVPLQHVSEHILRAMGRAGDKDAYRALFDKIRNACPKAALRTTFIVGFPGETEADIEELTDFVSEVRFDRLGVFKYSREEGTPASKLTGLPSKSAANARFRRLMKVQQGISLETNRALIGSRIEVLIEKINGDIAVGRSYRDAPEIDGIVRITNCGNLQPGCFISAQVTGAEHYDLLAKTEVTSDEL
jgi:ribosomal protein S12 methylthiotransferase